MSAVIDAADVRQSGVLMEANRLFFHPLGLEMFVAGRGFCLRDVGPTMASFGPAVLDSEEAREKSDAVEERRRRAAALRRSLFGWSVQAVGGRRDAVPLDFVWSERALDALFDAVGDAGQIVVGVLSGCWLLPGGVIEFVPADESEDADAGRWGLTAFQAGRLSWLSRHLPEIGAERLTEDGKPRPLSGALYESERVEVEKLAEEVAGWDALGAPAERSVEVLTRLEDLYGLAQPGMRFFRGDGAALDAWGSARPAVEVEMARYLESRPEVDKFLQGDITAGQLEDPVAVRAELAERLRSVDEQEAYVAEELESIRRVAAPLRNAAARLYGDEPVFAETPEEDAARLTADAAEERAVDMLRRIKGAAEECEDPGDYVLWVQSLEIP